MERVTQYRWKAWIVFGTFFLFLLGNMNALGDVVLLKPPKKRDPKAEHYPESRFGQAPAPIHLRREVDEMDRTQRAPAGLVMGKPGSQPGESQSALVTTSPKQMPEPRTRRSRRGVQEVALIAGDLGFFPRTVFVTRDIPVRMYVTGASKKTLCIMIDSLQIRKQVRARQIEEIQFVPSMPGRYRFYCPVNGMEGTMIVKELSTAYPMQASR